MPWISQLQIHNVATTFYTNSKSLDSVTDTSWNNHLKKSSNVIRPHWMYRKNGFLKPQYSISQTAARWPDFLPLVPTQKRIHATFLLHHDHWLLTALLVLWWGGGSGRESAASSCLPCLVSPALFPRWIQTWGYDEREWERRERARRELKNRQTRSQTRQPLSNCWLGLRVSSSPPSSYTCILCVCGLCPRRSEITRLQLPCDKCRFHSSNPSESQTPP